MTVRPALVVAFVGCLLAHPAWAAEEDEGCAHHAIDVAPRIKAVLGPTISGANYEVGGELRDAVLAAPGGADSQFALSSRAGHYMFDLQAYILARLDGAGVEAAATGHCTYGDEVTFFSYRRATHRNEPDYGRQISVIKLG